MAGSDNHSEWLVEQRFLDNVRRRRWIAQRAEQPVNLPITKRMELLDVRSVENAHTRLRESLQ